MNDESKAEPNIPAGLRMAWRAGPLLLLAALAAMLMWWQSREPARPHPADGPPILGTALLVVDYDQSPRNQPLELQIPCAAEMTVFDQLRRAAAEHGEVSFKSQGAGEATIVTAINGVSNEGAGETANNWTYRVNDEKPHASCAVQTIRPGDTVLWKFGPYE